MNIEAQKVLSRFRKVAVAEGWSFIILLFIAMPFKYLLGFPLLVKYVGWAHGALFLAYLLLGLQTAIACSWRLGKVTWAVLASFIPFGTFVLDKQLKTELEAGGLASLHQYKK
jgi:integral membrane protein